jgi:hypothetical protein
MCEHLKCYGGENLHYFVSRARLNAILILENMILREMQYLISRSIEVPRVNLQNQFFFASIDIVPLSSHVYPERIDSSLFLMDFHC